jgi:hypothetical protein
VRFTILLTVLAGAAVMTGCASAVAIHPLYTSNELVYDLPLEGAWEGNDAVAAVPAGDSKQISEYTVHLLRLKEYEFVDVASKSDPEVGIAGHLFGKISMQRGQLYVSPIDAAWLKSMVEAGLAPQSTLGEGQLIVLTAPTGELQQFILMHAADADAWDEDDEGLHRLR